MRRFIGACVRTAVDYWPLLLLMAASLVVATVTGSVLKIYHPASNWSWWLGLLIGLVVVTAMPVDAYFSTTFPDKNRYCCAVWIIAGLTGWAIFTLVDATIRPNWPDQMLSSVILPILARYIIYILFNK